MSDEAIVAAQAWLGRFLEAWNGRRPGAGARRAALPTCDGRARWRPGELAGLCLNHRYMLGSMRAGSREAFAADILPALRE